MFGNRVKVILTENFYVLSVLPFPLTTDNNAKSLGVIQTVRVNAMQQKMQSEAKTSKSCYTTPQSPQRQDQRICLLHSINKSHRVNI